jgi:asparagine synthase (glutamine-hydrolysing)
MNYIESLDTVLENVIKKKLESNAHFGLLFSGGLDSSLLAKFCIDLGTNPTLISVFMVGSVDETHTREAASFFDLNHAVREISPGEIGGYVKKVSLAASTKSFLDLSIGVPLYAALEASKESGAESVLVGQGADELFGGYHRYLKMDKRRLEMALVKDIQTINIERDRAIARDCRVKLLTPYLDEAVIKLGLSIPVEWKIRNGTRKFILREVAKKRGVPERIWTREKKAIQYSTGVDKVVKKKIKRDGFL